MEPYTPFPQIIEQLAILLRNKPSGVFFIATDTNESARLGITAGHITHCSFRRSHGAAAVDELRQIHAAKCSFAENSRFPFRDKDKVAHDTVLLNLDITLPVVDEETDKADNPVTAAETSPPPAESSTMIYRGKVVKVADKASPNGTPKSSKSPKKSQRIYRGKVIEY